MRKISFADRVRYWFDGVMARGTGALMVLLAVVTVVFIALVALAVQVFSLFPAGATGADAPGFGEVLWGNLMRTLDSGTMGGDEGWGFRAAMLVVTVGGVIIVASLIGIISGAFDARVEALRKGRSRVLESDHTLILGWNSKVFPILRELCIANESRRRSTIVILADRDKVEMEDAIRVQVGRTGRTRIVCRSGNPMNLADLEISSLHTARSVVLLAPEDSSDRDSAVIKTALAITNNPRRTAGQYHVVAEIQDRANLEAARLVGRDEVHWVVASDLISRITVQSCRQSGLSVVYTELLDFEGDEIYFTAEPALHGRTYLDAQLAYADCTVIGILTAGRVMLNPDAETVYSAGDQLILIAEDDSAIRLGGEPVADPSAISDAKPLEVAPERTLVLGYGAGLHTILSELAEYVAAGSEVLVVADMATPLLDSFPGLEIVFRRGDTTSRAVLESLSVSSFDHVIVLAYKETLDPHRADAKTLITLLHLRDMADREGVDYTVVSEMVDDGNRELAEVTRADDFIVSDKLISLMLSQTSENRRLTEVFDTLFSSRGSEIYLRPVDRYIREGADVNFYTIVAAARQRGETAIGYRIAADARDSGRAYGVRVNPLKSDVVTFVPDDRIIVLADA